jgi:hypothetical protein
MAVIAINYICSGGIKAASTTFCASRMQSVVDTPYHLHQLLLTNSKFTFPIA